MSSDPYFSIDDHVLVSRIEEHLSKPCKELVCYTSGSHHRIYRATLYDDTCVIARVHFPSLRRPGTGNGITPSGKMMSEIATMKFVKENTKIPVPEVLAYDSDEDGKVGGEGMLMEYVDGLDVQEAWQNMDEDQRALAVQAIADVWVELLGLRFSRIGSIWEDGRNGFKVGPMTFMPSNNIYTLSAPDPNKCGPFESPRDMNYKLSLHRDDAQLRHKDTVIQKIMDDGVLPELPDDHLSRIALEHKDMNYSNIVLDPMDPTTIKSVIDWEGARTVPLWAIQPRPFLDFDMPIMGEEDKKKYQRLFRSYVGEKVPDWLAATGEPGKTLRSYLGLAQRSTLLQAEEFFERGDRWQQGLDNLQ
ncbi:hypothetical protein OE88DRAFT_1737353 [Heliocybe sulcata]|uniref:Aminoglycoside phosphotransferase domain-containing protein n=1 Tax=Heliocybe sulcata TaxID=5364 RepID=A0A5C3MYA9_9AGAM|nr:hypothetical protein OE88DRAFT_1737353 [Heliocybe sulcata]